MKIIFKCENKKMFFQKGDVPHIGRCGDHARVRHESHAHGARGDALLFSP